VPGAAGGTSSTAAATNTSALFGIYGWGWDFSASVGLVALDDTRSADSEESFRVVAAMQV
jgi:hypothetical protein